MKSLKNAKLHELVEKQLKAYNEQNLSEFCGCFSPDIEVVDLSGRRPAMTGIENFRQSYAELFKKFPKNHAKVLNRIYQNNFIIDHEEITGRGPEPIYATAAYQLEGDFIRQVWFFW